VNKPGVIGVCHGLRCKDYGGEILAAQLKYQGVKVEVLDCQSLCTYSPIACKAGHIIHRASMQRVAEF